MRKSALPRFDLRQDGVTFSIALVRLAKVHESHPVGDVFGVGFLHEG